MSLRGRPTPYATTRPPSWSIAEGHGVADAQPGAAAAAGHCEPVRLADRALSGGDQLRYGEGSGRRPSSLGG